MRQITLFIAIALSSLTSSAYTISLAEIDLNLTTVQAEKLGIVVWDQRSQVVDGTQSAGLVGYTRRVAYAAFPVVTESNEALAAVLAKKIQTAHKSNGLKSEVILTAPKNNWEQVKERMTASGCDKFLVLKISKFEFDGIKKYEFKVTMDIDVYDGNINLLKSNQFSEIREEKKSHMNANDYKKRMPPILKSLMEEALNNEQVVESFTIVSKAAPEQTSTTNDLIVTKKGDEIEAKVEEITPEMIKYRKASQTDGPLRNIPISDVFMIKYKDGTKEVF